MVKLKSSTLLSDDISKGYLLYWWLSIFYLVPISNLLLVDNILNELYFCILPKMGVNQHFPKLMIDALTFIGGLGLLKFE